jgi:polysaccharide pyruvyl transferase WcaK-like protein
LGSLICLRDPFSFRRCGHRVVVAFGVADLAFDLRDRHARRVRQQRLLSLRGIARAGPSGRR